MKMFKDRLGREWTVELTVASMRRVKDLAQVDLLKIGSGKVDSLTNDPYKIVEVIGVLVNPQIKERGLSMDVFLEGLSGESLDAASQALLDEVIDFFPSRRGVILRKIMATAREIDEQTTKEALETVEAPGFKAKMAKAMSMGGSLSTSSPESPESIQGQ